MNYTKADMNLENGLTKEWIITNGRGGFASSTIIGANKRRYNGLLVAALKQPGKRHLILSKLDESVELRGKKYDLYTNICENYISDGYKYLEGFEKEYVPVFTYKVDDVIIKKYICMEYGKNTVAVLYKLRNTDSKMKLTLAPVINFRDFHSMTTNHKFEIKQQLTKRKVRIEVDKNEETPIYINASEGKYIEHKDDQFRNMFYIEEQKRGFYPEENHVVPGRYEIEINPYEEKDITFICSLEENIEGKDGVKLVTQEIARISSLLYDSDLLPKRRINMNQGKLAVLRNYVVAADQFVVYRPAFKKHTIIAGYPWFLDWGRDTLIALEGILLIPKRYDIAKEVLLTFIRDVKCGLVPNGYAEEDNKPLYNSADASLLLFQQVHRFLKYTQDYDFVQRKMYPTMKKIIEEYTKGIDLDNNNIFLDEDGLISSGTENTQNTWMDAKYMNFAATPRNGKAVEINALWYNANKIMEELADKFGDSDEVKKYRASARKCKKSFEEKFYNNRRRCLFDVIGDGKIRPNQLFALSLDYPVLDPKSEKAENVMRVVKAKLLNPYGLKTLAKGEKDYVEVYEGDSFKRDMSYHQGITWPWLLGLYFDSLNNMIEKAPTKIKKEILEKEKEEFIDQVEKTFFAAMFAGQTVGSISEIYDSNKTHEARGTIAQAWSVAEVYRIILSRLKK